MLHISDLGEFAHRFFSDRDGNVPEPGDHWRDMAIDHGENDPNEPGIDETERQQRITWLNENWWPEVIAEVNREKDKLSQLPGGNPIRKWRDEVMKEPPQAEGFGLDYE